MSTTTDSPSNNFREDDERHQEMRDLLDRSTSGDQEASRALVEHFAVRLTALAAAHLEGRLRGRLDAEDVVQSVFRTFFRRAAVGDFRIDGDAELWKLLARVTVMKARAHARHHTAQRRSVRAELPSSEEDWLHRSMAREPDPGDAAALVDQIDQALAGLPTVYAEILSLRLEGHAPTAIAARVGLSRATVYRALSVLRTRFSQIVVADEDE